MADEIYLIRHGLTESNKKKIYAGWSEEYLCQEGLGVLFEIGRELTKFKIEKIFSSPIQRAVQTANIINSFLNTTVENEENFKEMKMGPWEGLSEEEVAARFPKEWKIWNATPSKLNLPGRETLKELQLRALKAIKKMSSKSDSSKVLAVTHVAIIRVLMIHYNNLSINDYRGIDVPNGAVYILDNKAQNKKLIRML